MTPDAPSPRIVEAPEMTGDHLNAQRFLQQYGSTVRRSPELNRWFLWNGAWWQEDHLQRIEAMATACVEGLRAWAADAGGAEEFKRRSKHYMESAKAGRRDAFLRIVGSEPVIVVAVNQLDAHPLLLACRNGTINLKTGELTAANPDHLLTRGVDIVYDADADSPEWDEFLRTIFNNDTGLISYVQRLLGYCCTGVVAEHVLPVLHGVGANGKSTLIGVLQRILGDHAMTAPEGLVIRHSHEPHPERIAELRGKRFGACQVF